MPTQRPRGPSSGSDKRKRVSVLQTLNAALRLKTKVVGLLPTSTVTT
jgi:hypothetical protein